MDSPAGTDDPPPFAASGHYSLRPRDRRAPPSTNPRKRPRISIQNDVIGDIGEARGYARPMGLAAVLDLALSPSPSSDIWQNFAMEYRAKFGISCLYDEFVMEVMWGLTNLMHSLVPEENSQLSKEDRLQMSQGLKMLLNRYGFDVKPGMVNKRILEAASDLYDCDDCEKKNNWSLRRAGRNLMDISSINSEDWGLLKLSTALMIVCYPEEKIIACLLKHSTDLLIASYPRREVIEYSQKMFSPDVLSKLVTDAPKYGIWIKKRTSKRIHEEMVFLYQQRIEKRKLLATLIGEATKVYEAEQAELLTN
ncbi:hypothetical protein OsJ_06879 [Oryza sativa Japonica Group]|uniref:Uncharacterized protein n=1 Tax=Oryza sativa subsp. japonica TaxID=39947 RepID=A3A7A5_ORYSJ|nr:hypothetical protein OsJ_06879 [Oryza sativa Japonica Group]